MGSQFRLTTTKGTTSYEFAGSFPEPQESWVVDMLTSMREGLEANGFEVDMKITLTTEHSL